VSTFCRASGSALGNNADGAARLRAQACNERKDIDKFQGYGNCISLTLRLLLLFERTHGIDVGRTHGG
jgi:hypothetical protein